MANKRRPKKTRGLHYRRYVYGPVASSEGERLNPVDDGLLNSESSTSTSMQDESPDHEGDKSIVDSRSFHRQWYGEVWPSSKFQKVDVLGVAIALHEGLSVLPPWQEDDYEKRLQNRKIELRGLKLPFEIIMEIIRHTDDSERRNQLLICKSVYYMLLPDVYSYPKLSTTNFLKFVDVMMQRENKRRFRDSVKVLDLSNLIQAGKVSYVSKLLKRFSESLEVFMSSQSSFGLSSLVSLRYCKRLKVLDLNLVSETVNLRELFRCIHNLPSLEQLSFPRSSITCEEYGMEWPPNLWYLKLQGGITDDFLMNSNFPDTITNLEFAHCPNVTDEGVCDLLGRIGRQLKRLSAYYPMPMLSATAFDFAFLYCPNLKLFYTSISYISGDVFSETFLPELVNKNRPLRNLIIDSPGQLGQGAKLDPDDITVAVSEERLPCLRSISLSSLLGWDFMSEPVQNLVSELEWRGGAVYRL
ncbi:DEKNAAC100184 [Brettanomyces naardenensis]|uniref:DEKNAAC100184 n=1 Tax=Brettanomyces naardenensis TaxID=13370 RepID=A0A448YFR9_BRENA|nr:DEKNAAC100184 [Brettanomyces naardenensis]